MNLFFVIDAVVVKKWKSYSTCFRYFLSYVKLQYGGKGETYSYKPVIPFLLLRILQCNPRMDYCLYIFESTEVVLGRIFTVRTVEKTPGNCRSYSSISAANVPRSPNLNSYSLYYTSVFALLGIRMERHDEEDECRVVYVQKISAIILIAMVILIMDHTAMKSTSIRINVYFMYTKWQKFTGYFPDARVNIILLTHIIHMHTCFRFRLQTLEKKLMFICSSA